MFLSVRKSWSAEVEYAHSISGGRISALRERIARNKYFIRKADYRARKQLEAWRSEIRAAEKEILELKKMHESASRTISYALGEEELNKVIDWSKINKEDYLLAMERSPIKDTEITILLKNALTDKISDREIYMKGIDTSYYYEGYTTFKTEEL